MRSASLLRSVTSVLRYTIPQCYKTTLHIRYGSKRGPDGLLVYKKVSYMVVNSVVDDRDGRREWKLEKNASDNARHESKTFATRIRFDLVEIQVWNEIFWKEGLIGFPEGFPEQSLFNIQI